MSAKTVAVMVSGGVDSLVAYKLAKASTNGSKVVPIFVDVGQPYLQKEQDLCRKFFPDLIEVKADLVSAKLDNVPTVMKPEIFGRNLLIAFYGALLGDEIWMAVLETETSIQAVRDKHPEFFHMTSALLTYLFKTKRHETKLWSPFTDMTKSQVVNLGVTTLGIPKAVIATTSSCYDGAQHSCGECPTCFKRWISMTNNLVEDQYEAHPFLSNNYATNILGKMWAQIEHDPTNSDLNNRFSTKRLIETACALKISIDGWPTKVGEYKVALHATPQVEGFIERVDQVYGLNWYAN